MANAKRDANNVPTLLGISSVDGVTPIPWKINPVTGRALIEATGMTSPLTTKGDVYTYDTADARLPVGTDGQVLTADSAEATGLKWTTVAGTGDVVGPASSTDNALVRFDSTTGKLIKNGTITQDDSGNLANVGTINGNPVATGTNTGDQTITLTGDVTGSGTGSFAATITSDSVTYDKMQDVSATDRLLGRSTAGAGTVEEIVCTAAGRALLDDADAAAQRTTLNVDVAGTDNSTDVTLAGTLDYLTISGQEITRNAIDLTTDVTGTLPVANGGTGVTTSTGTGNVVLSTSPTLTTPNLGTPSTLVATNATGTAANLTAGTATAANGLKSATTTVSVSAATAPTTGQVLTATSSTTATWQTPSSGGSKEIRIRIPGELIADTTTHQGIFWRNTSGATITISNVAFGVSKAAAGAGASAAFNIYKSSGTITDGIDTNAVNLFTAAVDLTTNNVSDTNVPDTTTVESGRWISLRNTASAGATNKASDLECIITYS